MASTGIKRKFLVHYVLLLAIIASILNCSHLRSSPEQIRKVTSQVTDDYLKSADDHPGNWVSYGRNYSEDRFSGLSQIDKKNVTRLGLAWSLNLGTTRGIETTPLVMEGIMFLSGPWGKVFAVDVRARKLIWVYDPNVPGSYAEKACCDVVNRGVALYLGKVYVGTLDGRLVALDASTGKLVWQVFTVDSAKNYTITGAPRVIGGKVIIGNGGADLGVRGYVTAYDAQTGKQIWRFYTVPGDPSQPFESKAMETAAKTWAGEWWKYGGGGTAWDAMAYDPYLKLLYIGTGNGSPWNWFRRSNGKGDNLFLSSIVALNAENGALVWYYQTTPGDHWDYTATQHLVLSDLVINGTIRKVIMQAPKNGFFYVLDRTNGKLISADPYTYVNWASRIDLLTGKPVETDFARYEKRNAVIAPGPVGGHNWQPMAFSPQTKLVYIPVHYGSSSYGNDPTWKFGQQKLNTGSTPDPNKQTRYDKKMLVEKSKGRLIAWDPIAKKQMWKVDYEASFWNSGVVATAGGLVFQGTADGRFVGYDAKTGDKLWETNVGSGAIGSPVTYLVDGVQYVSIAVGWGGSIGLVTKFTSENYPGTLYTFALDAKHPAPDFYETRKQLVVLPLKASNEEIKKGSILYDKHCNVCHGWPGSSGGGAIPNLAYSSENTFAIFENIVLRGTYQQKGMPNFGKRLNEDEVRNIKHFIIYSSIELQQHQKKSGKSLK